MRQQKVHEIRYLTGMGRAILFCGRVQVGLEAAVDSRGNPRRWKVSCKTCKKAAAKLHREESKAQCT